MSTNKEKSKIFVTRPDFPQIGMDILSENCDITKWNQPSVIPKAELLKNVIGKDGIFCYSANRIDKEVLDAAGPNLRVVSTCSVGYDHIDIKECKKRGIRIGYTPQVLTDATAELTMSLLLSTSRRLIEANKEVYNGGWSKWTPTWMCGPGLKDATIGILGFGRIGQEVAKRCVPFKPKEIIYSSRSEKNKIASEIGAKYVQFEELISHSDILIVCCALNEETKGLFNKKVFDKMKSNAIFINSARGGIVDQNALYNALKEGCIYAAGLDVTTPEPLPLEDPLLTLHNCVILPHIGSANISTRNDMSRVTAKNILLALEQKEMVFEII